MITILITSGMITSPITSGMITILITSGMITSPITSGMIIILITSGILIIFHADYGGNDDKRMLIRQVQEREYNHNRLWFSAYYGGNDNLKSGKFKRESNERQYVVGSPRGGQGRGGEVHDHQHQHQHHHHHHHHQHHHQYHQHH